MYSLLSLFAYTSLIYICPRLAGNILLDKCIMICLVASAIYDKHRDVPYEVNRFLWANEIYGRKEPDIQRSYVAGSLKKKVSDFFS